MKSRVWCFTNYALDFNYDEYMNTYDVGYIIVGREVCPSTGREHDQGFVYYNNPRDSVKRVAKELGYCHVEKCKGSIEQNCNYCSKDNNVREFGLKPKQGLRNDLTLIRNELLYNSKSVDEIVMENPMLYHQYGRTLNKIEDICLRKKYRNWMTECDWIYGETGVGKSRRAFEDFDPSTHYVFPNDGGWWDGYVGQEIVIFNEFRGQVQYSELLDLIDRYPKTVRRRNREPVPFLAKKIIICSCLRPKEVYYNLQEKDSLEQLLRRIKIIKMEQKCSEGNTGTSEPKIEFSNRRVKPDFPYGWQDPE